jgi:hypothetical protein
MSVCKFSRTAIGAGRAKTLAKFFKIGKDGGIDLETVTKPKTTLIKTTGFPLSRE